MAEQKTPRVSSSVALANTATIITHHGARIVVAPDREEDSIFSVAVGHRHATCSLARLGLLKVEVWIRGFRLDEFGSKNGQGLSR